MLKNSSTVTIFDTNYSYGYILENEKHSRFIMSIHTEKDDFIINVHCIKSHLHYLNIADILRKYCEKYLDLFECMTFLDLEVF